MPDTGHTRKGSAVGANLLRITTVRIIVQTLCFILFLSFVLLTSFANLDRYPGLRMWVSKFIEVDPLISLGTALTTHTVYQGLLWSLVILIPTLFLGRFFCSWICPAGSLNHFVGWAFNRRNRDERIASNRYRRAYQLKYLVLIALLAAAACGTLQVGLLDPISLLYRSFTGAVLPAASVPTGRFFDDPRFYQGALLIGSMLFAVVALNLVIPRFFCRVLCPLGALMGVLSRFAWWRIERDEAKCVDCGQCLIDCEGACDPHLRIRSSECLVCLNCIEQCPHGARRFGFLPDPRDSIRTPDVPRRRAILAVLGGILFFPFARTSGRTTRAFASTVIRPPGAVEELDFLERCTKCDQCIRACPTNTLQPAGLQAGLEGLWTPILDFRIGFCQRHCTACGQVCPTGAIQRLSVSQKLGLGEFRGDGPIRLGTAHVDPGRCLPISKDIPCTVCEEVCPTSPKAILPQRRRHIVRDGIKTVVSATARTVTILQPLEDGTADNASPVLSPNCWQGDGTTAYLADVHHLDGETETHRLAGNTTDTLRIDGSFARIPQAGSRVVVHIELTAPQVDADRCVGCGICETKCPIVGDRRGIYVTAEDETRSRRHRDPDRNRSVRPVRSAE